MRSIAIAMISAAVGFIAGAGLVAAGLIAELEELDDTLDKAKADLKLCEDSLVQCRVELGKDVSPATEVDPVLGGDTLELGVKLAIGAVDDVLKLLKEEEG